VLWMVNTQREDGTVVINDGREATGQKRVDSERFRLLRPGEQIELARIDAEILTAAVKRDDPDSDPAALRVTARYFNQLSRQAIRETAMRTRRPSEQKLAQWAAGLERPIAAGSPASEPIPLLPR